MKLPAEHSGPHRLPYGQQERCAVEGRRIDGSGPCTVIAIRDHKQHGWVLYPHGNTGFGVLIADAAAHTLADRIGRPPRAATPTSATPTSLGTAPSSTRLPEARRDGR